MEGFIGGAALNRGHLPDHRLADQIQVRGADADVIAHPVWKKCGFVGVRQLFPRLEALDEPRPDDGSSIGDGGGDDRQLDRRDG